jgi:hypothetical protein
MVASTNVPVAIWMPLRLKCSFTFVSSLTNFYLTTAATLAEIAERLGVHQVNNMHGPTVRISKL